MERYYQCFKTQEDRKQWEKDQKKANSKFKVCFHIPVKQLAKEVYLTNEVKEGFRFATVYTFRES